MALSMNIEVMEASVRQIKEIPWQQGINVRQVMEKVYRIYEKDKIMKPIVEFTLEYFGPLGYLVAQLDSIEHQAGGDLHHWLFWEMLINGVRPNTGIEDTLPKDNDTITWKFTIYTEAEHAGTLYEEFHKAVMARKAGQLA